MLNIKTSKQRDVSLATLSRNRLECCVFDRNNNHSVRRKLGSGETFCRRRLPRSWFSLAYDCLYSCGGWTVQPGRWHRERDMTNRSRSTYNQNMWQVYFYSEQHILPRSIYPASKFNICWFFSDDITRSGSVTASHAAHAPVTITRRRYDAAGPRWSAFVKLRKYFYSFYRYYNWVNRL